MINIQFSLPDRIVMLIVEREKFYSLDDGDFDSERLRELDSIISQWFCIHVVSSNSELMKLAR